MVITKRNPILVGVLALSACAAEAPPPNPNVLLEADRAFDAAVAEGGSEAWGGWFAEDGALVLEGRGEIRGRIQVRDAVAFLDVPGVSLRWTPTRADIAASGDLGWTTGTYVSESPGPAGETLREEGVYVSIWRLQTDGSWKVVMDLGNPTTRPGEGGG